MRYFPTEVLSHANRNTLVQQNYTRAPVDNEYRRIKSSINIQPIWDERRFSGKLFGNYNNSEEGAIMYANTAMYGMIDQWLRTAV